jgi:hypothetical protein
MTTWEYLVENAPVDNAQNVTARLKALGDQGWELTFCLPDSADPRWALVFLKRPKSG